MFVQNVHHSSLVTQGVHNGMLLGSAQEHSLFKPHIVDISCDRVMSSLHLANNI